MPPTRDFYINKIKVEIPTIASIQSYWTNNICTHTTPGFPVGKAFEFFICRAFELENAEVEYPYSVKMDSKEVEQIDGAVHFDNFSFIVEAKHYTEDPINIQPIGKMRNQLLRRPSSAIGAVFSFTGFTDPALKLSQFMAPQTILLWEKDHIGFCAEPKNHCTFKEGMVKKYRKAINSCDYNFAIDI